MMLAIDVHYRDDLGHAAGVLFSDWQASVPDATLTSRVTSVGAYEPGQFYKRELPCLLQLIRDHHIRPSTVIIDGYVFLDGLSRPGLGKHLFDALGGSVTVIGVAKSHFAGIGDAFAITRGTSKRPIFVTAVGIELLEAQQHIRAMAGAFRLPDLLKQADRVAKDQSAGERT